MKRTLILTILFLLAAPAVVFAQPSVPGVRYVSVAPTGACSQSPPVQVLNSSGDIYTCDNGTWTDKTNGGGGSGVTQITAGTNVTISPSGGTGNVTINASGGGGTTTNALTAAATGGAAPGSTFNGNAAVTFDYHSFGAQKALSLFAGTYVDGDMCTYTAAGTLLNCNTAIPATGIPVPSGGTAGTQPFTLCETPSGGVQGTWNPCLPGLPGRTVTGATDTITEADRQHTVTYNYGSAVAVTLTSAATLGSNISFAVQNIGAGAATFTPGAGTINGASTLVLSQGQNCAVSSPDNTNYIARCASGQVTASGGVTATPSAYGTALSLTNTAATVNGQTCTLGSTCTVTAAPNAAINLAASGAGGVTGQLPIGQVGSVGLSASGGVSIASTGAISLSAIPLSALANQAADTVHMNATGGSAAMTAVAMPTCTTGADLYNTSTHAWSCVSTGGSAASSFTQTSPALKSDTGQVFTTSANYIVILGSIKLSGATINREIFDVIAADSGASLYDVGLAGPNCLAGASACPVAVHIGATSLATTGAKSIAVVSAPVTPADGQYWVVVTSNGTTASLAITGYQPTQLLPLTSASSSTSSSGGALPSTIAIPAAGATLAPNAVYVGFSQ